MALKVVLRALREQPTLVAAVVVGIQPVTQVDLVL
jgi:hypothetical protein